MAKINGVELKSVKEGFGHERNGLEASIYLDGKRVGSVENDGVGGCNMYHWGEMNRKTGHWEHNKTAENELEKRRASYYAANPDPNGFEDLDMFFDKIIELRWIEKQFKSMVKKSHFKVIAYAPSKFVDNEYYGNLCIQSVSKNNAEDAMQRHGRADFKFYTDASDFIITTDESQKVDKVAN